MARLILSLLIYLQSSPRLSGLISWGLALVIIVLSLTPLEELPPVPGGDKSHHLIAYAALAFPNALARPQKVIFFAVLYAGLGGGIELVQPFANRYSSWLDVAANLGGIALGSAFGIYLGRYLDRTASAKKPARI